MLAVYNHKDTTVLQLLLSTSCLTQSIYRFQRTWFNTFMYRIRSLNNLGVLTILVFIFRLRVHALLGLRNGCRVANSFQGWRLDCNFFSDGENEIETFWLIWIKHALLAMACVVKQYISPLSIPKIGHNVNYITEDDRVILFSGISRPNDTILRFPAFPTLTAVLNYARSEVCLQNSILITLPFFLISGSYTTNWKNNSFQAKQLVVEFI